MHMSLLCLSMKYQQTILKELCYIITTYQKPNLNLSVKFLYSFPTLYYLHLIYTSFLVAFSPAAYISPTFLSSISHLSPTSSLLFASNTQLPTQYCLVVVHVCSLSGASSLSSGRAVQVAFMHTHTYTHTEDENLCHSLSHRCPH